MVWTTIPQLDDMNGSSKNTLVEHLGITFTEAGDDYLIATMPVDHRTVQPMGLLHGGASVVLAESMGSVASVLCLDDREKYAAVGVEINANHLNSVPSGDVVTGTARPLKIGRTMHVWEIKIRRSDGKLVCVSRITIAVVARR